MSYILDALKKSEQERGHGTAPTVQTLHSSGVNYHSSRSQLWPYFLLVAVFINLAALLYFIMTRSDAETAAAVPTAGQGAEVASQDAALMVAQTSPAANRIRTDETDAVFYKPVSIPVAGRAVVPVAPVMTAPDRAAPPPAPRVAMAQPVADPVMEMHEPGVLELHELPYDIQQRIPVMQFSAHVYSSNPLQRSVVINGRFMEEGDYLESDLYLSEITTDGAIFDFQGQRFHQRIVSAWN